MAEYIERNELIKNLNKFAPEHYNALINDLIIKQPVADVEPVRRGHWTPHGSPPENIWCCSECKALTETAHYCNKCYYDYCPNCGAKMGGEENA